MYAPPLSDLMSRIIGGGNMLKYSLLYFIVAEIHVCKYTQFPRYSKKNLNQNQEKTHAVVNLFRNSVNDVRKLSTFPVQRVATASGKRQKTVNQKQEKTKTIVSYSCYSATVRKQGIR